MEDLLLTLLFLFLSYFHCDLDNRANRKARSTWHDLHFLSHQCSIIFSKK